VIVVDASALLESLLGTPNSDAVEERLFQSQQPLHVPHLIDLEIAQVLRRYEAAGLIQLGHGHAALSVFAELSLHRHSHHVLLPRVWELRNNLTAYDAVYVALAEALDAPLVTRDRRLGNAAGHRARIELV
jgi:predicted nucleic acid-binding protein